jgi:AcrR family transcriptional regulator
MKNKKDFKIQILETALDLYSENQMQFSLSNVAKRLKVTRGKVYSQFSTKNSVLIYFYQSCFENYLKQTNEISEYSQFTIEEKLGHLVYTHIELFQKEKEFVESTFNELIYKSNGKNIFQKSLEVQIANILKESEGDASILPGKYLSNFMVKELFHIFKFWIKDDSEQSEQTIELTDKIIAFVGEILRNQIFTKGIELGRTLYDKDLIRFSSKGLNLFLKSFLHRFA